MKATVWIFMQNNGDGSSSALFFNTNAKAEAYAEDHFEKCGERLCEDVYSHTFEFDANGKLLNPDKIEEN